MNMELTFDEERIYNFIYEDGIIKYNTILTDIDFNILINLRKRNLIYSFIDSENNLCYKLRKDHPYYIKRKRSDSIKKFINNV